MKRPYLIASLLCISLIAQLTDCITPALADIAKAFPVVPINMIQMLAAITSLFIVLGTLASGYLSSRVDRKNILYVGLAVEIVSGAVAVLANSFGMLLFARCFLGVGIGLIAPFAAGALMRDFFSDKEYQTMMGMASAATFIGSVLILLLSGYLCAADWHYTFLVIGLAVPVLILVGTGLPALPKAPPVSAGEKKARLGTGVYVDAVALALVMACVVSFAMNIAIVLHQAKIGNPATVGVVMTWSTVGGFIAGLIFGKSRSALGEFGAAIPVAVISLSFFLLYGAGSLLLIIAGGFFIGIGQGLLIPFIMARVGLQVPASAVAMAYSVIMVAINVGIFLSVILLPLMARAIMGASAGRPIFLLAGIGLACGAVGSGIVAVRTARKIPDNTVM